MKVKILHSDFPGVIRVGKIYDAYTKNDRWYIPATTSFGVNHHFMFFPNEVEIIPDPAPAQSDWMATHSNPLWTGYYNLSTGVEVELSTNLPKSGIVGHTIIDAEHADAWAQLVGHRWNEVQS